MIDTSALAPEQAVTVDEAVTRWRDASGIDLGQKQGEVISVRDAALDGYAGSTDFTADGVSVAIDFARLTCPGQLEVAMHEIGHLFGLADGSGLMREDGWNGACVDAETLRVVCASYPCAADAHATCDSAP